MKRFRYLLVGLLLQACIFGGAKDKPGKPASPSPGDDSAPVRSAAPRDNTRSEVEIRGHQEIWVRKPASDWHLLTRAPSKVVFVDPQISPNGKWLTVVELGPIQAKGRTQEVEVLVDLESGSRTYGYEFPPRFRVEGIPALFRWTLGKPATLEVTLSGERGETQTIELDLTPYEKGSMP